MEYSIKKEREREREGGGTVHDLFKIVNYYCSSCQVVSDRIENVILRKYNEFDIRSPTISFKLSAMQEILFLL